MAKLISAKQLEFVDLTNIDEQNNSNMKKARGLNMNRGMQNTYDDMTAKQNPYDDMTGVKQNPNDATVKQNPYDDMTGVKQNTNDVTVKQNPYDDMTGVKQNTNDVTVKQNPYDDMTGVKQNTNADMAGVMQSTYENSTYEDMANILPAVHNPMYLIPDTVLNNKQNEKIVNSSKWSNRQEPHKSENNTEMMRRTRNALEGQRPHAFHNGNQPQAGKREHINPNIKVERTALNRSGHYQIPRNTCVGYEHLEETAMAKHKVGIERSAAIAAIESVYLTTESDLAKGLDNWGMSDEKLLDCGEASAQDQETYCSLQDQDITIVVGGQNTRGEEPSRVASQREQKDVESSSHLTMIVIAVILGCLYLTGVVIIVYSIKQAQPCAEQCQQTARILIPVTDQSIQLKPCQPTNSSLFRFSTNTADWVPSGDSTYYTCTENYEAVGNEPKQYVTCKEGKWSPEPRCIQKTTSPPTSARPAKSCTEPEDTETINYHNPGKTVQSGRSIDYDCQSGFYSGNHNFDSTTCNDGVWDPIPKCVPDAVSSLYD